MSLKKVLSVLLLLSLLLTMAFPVFAAEEEEEEPAKAAYQHDIFKTPVGAAYLYERNSGQVLYELNADEKKYPASLTKIMTCMLVLENGNLNDIITAPDNVLDGLEVGSSLGSDHLLPGEQMRLEDMLYFLMLTSSNESCLVLAEYVSGSVDAFVDLMNQTAKDLGCTGTHFANPHGLHDEDHYTTARDIAKITLKALENETFRTISNTASYQLPATNMRKPSTIYSTNNLINKDRANNQFYYSKAAGVKTGFTTPAGECLVSTASNDNLDLLGVILKAQTVEDENGNWWKRNFPECINLFEWGFEHYKISTVMSTLYPVAEIPVNMAAGSETVALAPTSEIRTLIDADYDPADINLDIRLNATSVDAPVEAGQVLGTVTVTYKEQILGTRDLGAITNVSRSEITHKANETKVYVKDNWWKWLVGILIGIVVVLVVCFFLLQYYRRQQRKRKVAARRRALELQRRKQEWNIPDDR